MSRKTLIRTTVKGDEEIRKVLLALPEEIQKNVLRNALPRAARPLLAAMRMNAPMSSGYSAYRRRREGRPPLVGTLGMQTKARRVVRTRIGAWYPAGAHAHLTEFGTKQRFTKEPMMIRTSHGAMREIPAGRNRGIMPATHWMLKSWNETGDQVLGLMLQYIEEGIFKTAKRLRKKYEKSHGGGGS